MVFGYFRDNLKLLQTFIIKISSSLYNFELNAADFENLI